MAAILNKHKINSRPSSARDDASDDEPARKRQRGSPSPPHNNDDADQSVSETTESSSRSVSAWDSAEDEEWLCESTSSDTRRRRRERRNRRTRIERGNRKYTAEEDKEYKLAVEYLQDYDHSFCGDRFNNGVCTADHEVGVYYDAGWGDNGLGEYTVGCDFDGTEISKRTFERLFDNKIIGGNVYVGYKARGVYPALFGRADNSVVGKDLYRSKFPGVSLLTKSDGKPLPQIMGCDGKPLFATDDD
jgi:hypothetical protein